MNWLAEMAQCVTVDDYWDKFPQVICNGIEPFAPWFKTTKHFANVRTYPKEIRILISHKHNCWKLYRQFKTNNFYAKYKCAAKKCTLAINDHLTMIENDLISDGRLGNFYKHISKQFNGSNGIVPLKN